MRRSHGSSAIFCPALLPNDAMPRLTPWVLNAFVAAGMALSTPARCDDADALALQSAPTPEAGQESPLRVALELGVGRIDRRTVPTTQDGRRVSVDLRYSKRLTEAWRLALSDRLDDTHPAPDGQRTTSNSLREAYLAWQEPGESTSLDFGRVNLRQGPAFGYNPTDYFRVGALRSITTADPVALREMRMGTVMLRLGRLSSSGAVALIVAPKLATTQSLSPASLDLGATNSRDRALLTVSPRFTERFSGQGLLLLERGSGPTVGASMTALATDSLVTYAEWSSGKSLSVLDQTLGSAAAPVRAQQAALGLTYTLPNSLAMTLEAEYNGAGLDRAGWDTVLNQGGYQRCMAITQPSQELGSRRAWLLYASQKSLGLKQLDLTGFIRTNAVDSSRFVWAELRYHWPRFDAALQWQRASGNARSELGVMPYRQVVQLLGVLFL